MCWNAERSLSRFNAVPDCPFLHEPVSLLRCLRLSFTSCVGTWNAACLTSMLFQTVLSFMSLSHFNAVPDGPLLHVLGRGTQPVSLQRCSRLSFTSCVGTWNAACRTSTLFQTVLSFVYMVMVQTLIDASGVQFAVMLLAVPDDPGCFLLGSVCG